jgi:hypothetical protein
MVRFSENGVAGKMEGESLVVAPEREGVVLK